MGIHATSYKSSRKERFSSPEYLGEVSKNQKGERTWKTKQ